MTHYVPFFHPEALKVRSLQHKGHLSADSVCPKTAINDHCHGSTGCVVAVNCARAYVLWFNININMLNPSQLVSLKQSTFLFWVRRTLSNVRITSLAFTNNINTCKQLSQRMTETWQKFDRNLTEKQKMQGRNGTPITVCDTTPP